MRIISWQKAITLCFQAKVDIIENHEIFVKSMRTKHSLPSIIRLRTYINFKPFLRQQFTRTNVFRRDEYICQYCGIEFDSAKLTLDHVIPVSRGGKKCWDNIVSACQECNQKKADRTPKEARMNLLKQPSAPKWNPYVSLGIRARESIPETWKFYLKDLAAS